MSAALPRLAPRWSTSVLRLFFAALLLIAGGAKLINTAGFFTVVDSYSVLPQSLLAPAAWALTLTELALGLWLLTAKRLRMAATSVIALHCMYLAWLLAALARGLSIPNCGCFGVYWPRPLTWHTPLEDLGLLSLAALLWWLHRPSTPKSART